jgi:hypothetical protein
MTLLREALIVERTEDSHVFRLQVQDNEFVLGIDQAQDDDVQYDLDGTTVLAAPQDVASSLLGETTIDVESTTEGPRLVLVNAA